MNIFEGVSIGAYLSTWLVGSIMVVGIIEWGKNNVNSINDIVFILLSPILSLIVAYSLLLNEHEDYTALFVNSLGIWAVSQLAYGMIVKKFTKHNESSDDNDEDECGK